MFWENFHLTLPLELRRLVQNLAAHEENFHFQTSTVTDLYTVIFDLFYYPEEDTMAKDKYELSSPVLNSPKEARKLCKVFIQ